MSMRLYYSEKTTFEDVVSALDQSGHGFLSIIDKDDKLIGIITDGDIRRAILNKEICFDKIINKNPIVAHYETPIKKVYSQLKEAFRRHMPLVDDQGKLMDIVTLDDLEFNAKPNNVVIMAGGIGSRLGDLTEHTPKPMLNVGNKPLLEHLIEMFSEHGFTNFYFCINYKSEVIKANFGNGERFGIKISYIEEDKRLGTAGALSLLPEDMHEPFFVINGDVMTTLNFEDLLNFHVKTNSVATMCVRPHNYQIPYGVIETNEEGQIKSFVEKPSQKFNVNAGIYVLNPSVLKSVPHNTHYDMPSLFETLIKQGEKTMVFDVEEYWIDIGHIDDYKKANKDYSYTG